MQVKAPLFFMPHSDAPYQVLCLIPCCFHRMQVKAPLFFMLGAKDRRVPLDDAKQYINALRRV